MRLLLDTQIYLWFVADSRRLSRPARQRIAAAGEVLVSAASIWEAAIKVGLRKLDASVEELAAAIEPSGFKELPVMARHAAMASSLPGHHRDPFDRLLIAQAVHEPAHFLTADSFLAAYSPLVEVV